MLLADLTLTVVNLLHRAHLVVQSGLMLETPLTSRGNTVHLSVSMVQIPYVARIPTMRRSPTIRKTLTMDLAQIVQRILSVREALTVGCRTLTMAEVQNVPKTPTIQVVPIVSSSSSMLRLGTDSELTPTPVNLASLTGKTLHKGLREEQQALILNSQTSTKDLPAQLHL